jgi:hypothetical protein
MYIGLSAADATNIVGIKSRVADTFGMNSGSTPAQNP